MQAESSEATSLSDFIDDTSSTAFSNVSYGSGDEGRLLNDIVDEDYHNQVMYNLLNIYRRVS